MILILAGFILEIKWVLFRKKWDGIGCSLGKGMGGGKRGRWGGERFNGSRKGGVFNTQVTF